MHPLNRAVVQFQQQHVLLCIGHDSLAVQIGRLGFPTCPRSYHLYQQKSARKILCHSFTLFAFSTPQCRSGSQSKARTRKGFAAAPGHDKELECSLKHGGEKNAGALLPHLAPRMSTGSPSEEGMKLRSCSSSRCMATRLVLPQSRGTLNLQELSGHMFLYPTLVFTFRCAPGGSNEKTVSNSLRVRSSFIRPIHFPLKLTMIMLPTIVGDHTVIFSCPCTTISQSYTLVKSRVRMTQILCGKRRKPKAKRGK